MQTTTAPPTRPSAAALIEAVQLAQRALDDALIDDLDTAGPRAALGVAREALAAAQAADAQEAAAAAATERRVALEAATTAVKEAEEAFAAAVEVIESDAGAETLPEPPALPPLVALGTKELARARAALAAAQVPYRTAVETCGKRCGLGSIRSSASSTRSRLAASPATSSRAIQPRWSRSEMDVEGLAKMLAPLVTAAEVARRRPGNSRPSPPAEAALMKAKVGAELDAMVAGVRTTSKPHLYRAGSPAFAWKRRSRGYAKTRVRVFVASDALRKVSNGVWV